MYFKNFTKILAKALIIVLMIPNLNVDAEVIDTEVIEGTLVGQQYESKKVDIPFVETSNTYLTERIEYKLKMEALSNITVLDTKTDAEYEVALAHEDGSFTYVSSVDSMEEAMEEVETLSTELKENPEEIVDKLTNMSLTNTSTKLKYLNTSAADETVLPTVISNSGQIVYSTNSMARIIKYINGQPYLNADKVTNLYSESTLTNATDYINQMYVDDAPILQDAGASAKILVAGKEAWINKNTSKSEYDMIVVPLNQVKNPSYYIVENGELKHYISSNMTDTTASSGYKITIGKAPSYLTTGVKYFSYDGLYFYDGRDIESGLNTLINDYKAGTRANSVNSLNSGKPFYLYFNYLPFRSKTVYTAAELDSFINANTQSTSKLRGLGSALKEAEQNFGVNAAITLGVAINESSWGMSSIAQAKNNLFSINAIDSDPERAANEFATPAAAVFEYTKNYISRAYADPADWRYYGGFLGNKKAGANVKYASDPFWGEKAAQFAYRIDKYLSGSVTALKDTDAHQLAMATINNKVMKSDGSLLYNITNDMNQYGSYVNTPFIITKNSKITVSGQSTYEINPERTTPLNTGGTANKFIGDYDWNTKGYVIDSGIQFLNEAKNNESPGDGTVENAVTPVISVSLNKSSFALKPGGSTTLVATVSPTEASNKYVTWTSSNTSVATVDASGKVTAVANGLATITATTVDGGKTATATVTVISVPTSIRAVSASYNSINITWGAVSGASGYEIHRATSSTGTYSYLAAITGTTFTNINLITNATYYYKVRAYRIVGTAKVYGAFTTVVSAKPVPAVPTSMKALSASYNSINITWGAVAGASGYEIQRATSSTGTFSILASITGVRFTNINLITNKAYFYRVRAYRMVGTTKVYGGFTVVVSAKPIPSAPTTVKAVRASSTSINITWGSVAGASGYEIYRATSSTGTYSYLSAITGLKFTNIRLTAGATYYYKVRAYRIVGTTKVYSNWSAVVYAKP